MSALKELPAEILENIYSFNGIYRKIFSESLKYIKKNCCHHMYSNLLTPGDVSIRILFSEKLRIITLTCSKCSTKTIYCKPIFNIDYNFT